jgi:8-oxo-dGTP pyrophosphatase MutT (NUDIX family)
MIVRFLYKILNMSRNLVSHVISVKTVGARALVVRNDQVLLIKHTYQKGWYTIGGGVERNESPSEAIIRELAEEVGVTPTEKPELFSIYHKNDKKRDDYIAFYIIKKFELQDSSYSPEIAEKRWFPLHDLPPDTTPSTLKRIEEFLGIREKSDKW